MVQVSERLPTHKTILLIEDDQDIREIVAEILREEGHLVVEAKSGHEGLAKLDQLERPCLILLDLLMPRMDGREFLVRLKEHPHAPEFPVLVLSAHDDVQAADHYPGVLGTLRKPFDVRTLLSWVNEHC